MTVSKDNIEAFILTYNRKEYLSDAILSLLNQSVGDIKITVLDNGSNDGTEEVVKGLQENYKNLHYFKQTENDGLKMFNSFLNMLEKDYVIYFHDDDILHPDYIKYAIEAINKYPNTAIVSTYYKEYTNPNNSNWEKPSKALYYCKDKNSFVDYLCFMQSFAYSATIYKSSNLMRYKNEPSKVWNIYGKIGDKPYVIEIMQENDGAVIFKSKYLLRYRVHKGQDTQASGPYYHQIIALNKLYKSYMKRNKFSYFLFSLINYKQLKNAYDWGRDYTLAFNEFVERAISEDSGCFYTKLCISKIGVLFVKLAKFLIKFIKLLHPVQKI